MSPGTPWWEFDGANPAEVWAAAEKAARPRRRTLLEDALEGTASLEYHPLGGEES